MAYTNYSAQLTTGAANTKGAYIQLVAGTPYDSSRLHFLVRRSLVANPIRFVLVDVAVGAAGAEIVVVGNIAAHCDVDAVIGAFCALSVDIPAGSRIALRAQSVTASTPVFCDVYLEDRAPGGLTAPATYGTNTAASRGTQIDPGTTANVKGNYVELSASTTARIDAVLLCLTTGAQGQALSNLQTWSLDLATGAAGAETVVVPSVAMSGSSAADAVRPGVMRFPVSIPAGSRLAARCACSFNTANERLLCVSVIGMQEPPVVGGATTIAHGYVG